MQAQQVAVKKSGRTVATQKAAKRQIKISKIKIVPAVIIASVVATQY